MKVSIKGKTISELIKSWGNAPCAYLHEGDIIHADLGDLSGIERLTDIFDTYNQMWITVSADK